MSPGSPVQGDSPAVGDETTPLLPASPSPSPALARIRSLHHRRGSQASVPYGDMPPTSASLLSRIPLPKSLQAIPAPALRLIGLLVCVNAVVWAAAGVVLHFHPPLLSSAVLAYTLGLRHALDADHISAIDLTTRRLIAAGQRPVAVGTFFSLGHSAVVVATCVVVAATTGALRDRFDDISRVGNVVGTSVSAVFLLLLCAGNAWVLWRLVARLREELRRRGREGGSDDCAAAGGEQYRDVVDVVAGGGLPQRQTVQGDASADAPPDGGRHDPAAPGPQLPVEGGGILAVVFRRLFKVVDRPWKMFPLGIVFGLGFDTSSEIAILGLASIHGAEGTSLWLILIFPILFTAGMCMLDTTDGALMMALYTSKAFSRDVVAILYYSIVLTAITIFVSAFIGIIQVLSLVQNVLEPEGRFWDGVSAIGDNFDIIGGCICGVFLVIGVGSVLVYRPWRRRVERNRRGAGVDARTQPEALVSPLEG
ncbi:hypothetical protein RB595_006811 [Gaeumannomyces hyphopodioides]